MNTPTRWLTINIICLALLLITSVTFASEQVFSSGDKRTTLLELYTSEGCSSCPPADRWLSQFTTDPNLWERFVPVAFHVDYWDYLGWKDRFSNAEFSERQRQYALKGFTKTVYTPGFFKDGREFRNWYYQKNITLNNNQASVGSLTVKRSNNEMTATYEPVSSNLGQLVLNVAHLGSNIKTDVEDGENEGKILKHDFVVLSLQQYQSSTTSGSPHWLINSSKKINTQHPTKAMAFWVTTRNDPTPIQATGGWLSN